MSKQKMDMVVDLSRDGKRVTIVFALGREEFEFNLDKRNAAAMGEKIVALASSIIEGN